MQPETKESCFSLWSPYLTCKRLRGRFVDEGSQGVDFLCLQFQVRHLRRFHARICEKFLQVIGREPLAREIELCVRCVLRIDLHMAMTAGAPLGREQTNTSSRR